MKFTVLNGDKDKNVDTNMNMNNIIQSGIKGKAKAMDQIDEVIQDQILEEEILKISLMRPVLVYCTVKFADEH